MIARDGTTVEDQRLGRLVQFDQRSRSFPARDVVPRAQLDKSVSWYVPPTLRLNQGQEGACVLFSGSHVLIAPPDRVKVAKNRAGIEAWAHKHYRIVQERDPWPETHEGGEEGTSVLSSAQYFKELKLIKEYRWCFSIDEVVATLQNVGPVQFGTWWRSTMWDTDDQGVLDITGRKVGGHAYMIDSYYPNLKVGTRKIGRALGGTNTWGTLWGRNGRFYLPLDSAASLLDDDGEACVLLPRG